MLHHLAGKLLLSPADMTRLSEQIMRVSDVLCLSAVTIRGLVTRRPAPSCRGPPRREAGPAPGQHKGGHDIHGAFSMDRGPLDMLVQIVQAGKTDARLARAALAGAHSPRHIRERLGNDDHDPAADSHIGQRAEHGQEWNLLWNMASIHASVDTMTAMRVTFPHVVLCFLPPQSTSSLQPCDVTFFRSFKSCIQTQASATLARAVRDGTSKAWPRTKHGGASLRPNGQLAQSRTSAARTRFGTTGWRPLRAHSVAHSKKPSKRLPRSMLTMSSSPSTSRRSPLRKTLWSGPWQKHQTMTTTRPCQTRRPNRRSSTCRQLWRLHVRCRTWSASLGASCTALDRVEPAQKKKGTCITSQRPFSIVSRVRCFVCPGPHPCFHVLTTSPRHPDSDNPLCFFFLRWPPKVLTQGDSEQYPECQSDVNSDKRGCGSPAKAQAPARVDVPTAFFFCSADQGVQHSVQVFCVNA